MGFEAAIIGWGAFLVAVVVVGALSWFLTRDED